MSDSVCGWAPADNALYRKYHDEEWGVPERSARALFEKFQLDGFQAGLAWITILRKREAMREEFDQFDPARLARWDETRIATALTNPQIIRSPTKIRATVGNARVYMQMLEKGEDFAEYLWSFVEGKPLMSRLPSWRHAPTKTDLSAKIAKDMKRRGFKFCGPTIVYACLQAVGVVNDHEVACPRFTQVQKL